MPMEADIWWRCEVKEIAHWDYDGEYVTSRSYHIQWTACRVIKSTPKGVWVNDGPFSTRFILGTANKQHCVPTKELAYRDAVIRAARHVTGCKNRLLRAKAALAKLENYDLENAA